MYRDEVYHPETEFKGVAEIIIGKQRNGPLGTARLAFLGKYSRFENLAPGAYRSTTNKLQINECGCPGGMMGARFRS
ncbi:Replicative DNA helicase [compost metagenome]